MQCIGFRGESQEQAVETEQQFPDLGLAALDEEGEGELLSRVFMFF